MSRVAALALAGVLLTAGGALATSSGRGEKPEQVAVTYGCDDGLTVPVVFINPLRSDAGYAALVMDGQLMVLPLVRSGSGARYRAETEGSALELWIKGDEAAISGGPLGDERAFAQGCRVAR